MRGIKGARESVSERRGSFEGGNEGVSWENYLKKRIKNFKENF